MSGFMTVRSASEFRLLDEGEVLVGYLDGFHGGPAPTSSHSRAYWHGWRNGKIESGAFAPDEAYLELEEDFRCRQQMTH